MKMTKCDKQRNNRFSMAVKWRVYCRNPAAFSEANRTKRTPKKGREMTEARNYDES